MGDVHSLCHPDTLQSATPFVFYLESERASEAMEHLDYDGDLKCYVHRQDLSVRRPLHDWCFPDNWCCNESRDRCGRCSSDRYTYCCYECANCCGFACCSCAV